MQNNGEFKEGNPDTGEEASVLSASWLNSVQNELLNVLRYCGKEPDPNNQRQLQECLIQMAVLGPKPLTFSIENGVSEARVLPGEGFALQKDQYRAIRFFSMSERKTRTSQAYLLLLEHYAAFTEANGWTLTTQVCQQGVTVLGTGTSMPVNLNDLSHCLEIKNSGQLFYRTRHLDGADHKGTLTISHMSYLPVIYL